MSIDEVSVLLVKPLLNTRHTRYVPFARVLVECTCTMKYMTHIRHLRYTPLTYIIIKFATLSRRHILMTIGRSEGLKVLVRQVLTDEAVCLVYTW